MSKNKDGAVWYKQQLRALREILAASEPLLAKEHLWSGEQQELRDIGLQFVGSCRAVIGSHLPALHEPMLSELRRGMRAFGRLEIQDIGVIGDATDWVTQQRARHRRQGTKIPEPKERMSSVGGPGPGNVYG